MPRPDAAAHLAAAHPGLAALVERIGPCILEPVACEPFQALVRAITRQQIHGRAADLILGRFTALFPADPFPRPEQVRATPLEAMRGCGLSGSKAAAIQDIAAHALSGTVPTLADAAALDDEALIERLTVIRGVGRWTVEMLLIFTLGRPDVLPVDDWGVREGWRRVTGADAQLKPRALAGVGAAWAPYRSTAAWYLWRAADEGKKPPPA